MSQRPFTPPGDDEFDAALRARRPLLPRFDAHVDDEPPPELDRLVLSRAREALRRAAPPERHYRSPRWAAPLAIAATVLLSLGLVLQMDPSRNDAVLETGGDATAMTAMTDAEPMDAAESAGSARPSAPAAAIGPSPSAPAPAPAPAPPSARASAPASRAAPAPTVVAAPPFVADAPAERDLPELAATDDARASLRKQAAPVGAAAGASADRASAEIAEVAAAAASPRSAAAAAPPADAARAAIPRDEPQRWLDAIEQLRVAGELDAARRELAAFRLRHPGIALPEALDALR